MSELSISGILFLFSFRNVLYILIVVSNNRDTHKSSSIICGKVQCPRQFSKENTRVSLSVVTSGSPYADQPSSTGASLLTESSFNGAQRPF
jgi:hypothetical protein